MSDLTLEELESLQLSIEQACPWTPKFLHQLDQLIAAARAHLEGQECLCENVTRIIHQDCPQHGWATQPPQQREDDNGTNHTLPISTETNIPLMPLHELAQRDLGSILDAKDAEIEYWRSLYRNACKDRHEAQAEIERLREMNGSQGRIIGRLREALDCVLKYHCPNIQSVAVDRARAALKVGKP
jgi:hypothetical protein